MFGSNKYSYLGVDIGSSSIKVAELSNFKGRPRLSTYGFTEKSPAHISETGLISDSNEAAEILKDILKKSKTSSTKAVAALPNFSVFTSILTLSALNKKDLAAAISWEAKKIIPLPLEEIILDWKIIEEFETTEGGEQESGIDKSVMQDASPFKKIFSKPKKNVRILLTGASKNLIKKYVEIFQKAGLSLLSLETESFALIRSLLGNDKSTVMIIDMGASTSSLTVVSNGVPLLTRSLELGGQSITKAISAALNVNMDRAEQFKQDLSLDMETSENSLPQTVERSFSPILNEIKYTINLFNDNNTKKIEKLILTGGTALIGHLPGYLSDKFNINCNIGDPFSRVIFPTDLKPVLDRVGSRFSVAVGLAMREIE
ncbi:MAG: pilus assembly protein PilM [Candidatus Buchananbacteria bacterium]|jgi:type IV pilus assembly protein PilM